MKKVLLTLPLLASCQSLGWWIPDAELVAKNNELYTIRYTYGSLDEEKLRSFRNAYDKKLDEKALEICGGKPYEVTEKGRHPSTLANLVNLNEHDFYWVLKCN